MTCRASCPNTGPARCHRAHAGVASRLMIYRVLVVGLVACALSGCGGGAKTIDTPTLVRVLRGVGFRNLYVISNNAQLQKLRRRLHRSELARDPLDSDTILVRGYSPPLTMPLTAVR